MKKILLGILLVMLLGSCCWGNGPASQAGDGHSAQNALDYQGKYAPVGDSGGISALELGAGTYRLSLASGEVKSGKFTWNESGLVITLLGSGPPDLRCFVGENYLRVNGASPREGLRFDKLAP